MPSSFFKNVPSAAEELKKVVTCLQFSAFKFLDHQRFLSENEAPITAFKNNQQSAFEAERQRWIDSGQLNFSASDESAAAIDELAIPDGCIATPSHIPGNIWKILVSRNDTVTEGQPLRRRSPVNASETLIVIEG